MTARGATIAACHASASCPLVAAILLVLAGAADRHAGQYALAYDFGVRPLGLERLRRAGLRALRPRRDRRLPRRLDEPHHGPRGQRAADLVAGPLGVDRAARARRSSGGALAYRTRMRHPQFFARVKMRADGVDVGRSRPRS